MGFLGYFFGFVLVFSIISCFGVILLMVFYCCSNGNGLDGFIVRVCCRCGCFIIRN